MLLTKAQLQSKAKGLGISYKDTDTKSVLAKKILVAEVSKEEEPAPMGNAEVTFSAAIECLEEAKIILDRIRQDKTVKEAKRARAGRAIVNITRIVKYGLI